MSKFREGVEVIWGVAIDNSLETKVKITVLATGFGVEDVPGMDSLHAARSQEEEERQLQLEEEKEKNNENVNENNSSISGKERVDNHEVAENESSQNEESKTLSDPEKTNEPNDKVQ